MKQQTALKIRVSHPDPEIEKQGAKAVIDLIEAIAKLTGEEVKIQHVNPNCKDASRCNPHPETGPVTYREEHR